MNNNSIFQFAKTISGLFSNKEQALNNPKRFAHITIHIRPLYIETLKCYAFYSEQSYHHNKWNPYRQSINKLSLEKDIFIMSNYKIDNQERFIGAGLDIKNISLYQLYNMNRKIIINLID